jgi:hypothetical protein
MENQVAGRQARRHTKTGNAAKPALFFPAATLREKGMSDTPAKS